MRNEVRHGVFNALSFSHPIRQQTFQWCEISISACEFKSTRQFGTLWYSNFCPDIKYCNTCTQSGPSSTKARFLETQFAWKLIHSCLFIELKCLLLLSQFGCTALHLVEERSNQIYCKTHNFLKKIYLNRLHLRLLQETVSRQNGGVNRVTPNCVLGAG